MCYFFIWLLALRLPWGPGKAVGGGGTSDFKSDPSSGLTTQAGVEREWI